LCVAQHAFNVMMWLVMESGFGWASTDLGVV